MRPMPDFIQNGLADLRQLNMTTISETCVRYRHFSLAKPAPRIYNGVRKDLPAKGNVIPEGQEWRLSSEQSM